jgi:hypothetical protein
MKRTMLLLLAAAMLTVGLAGPADAKSRRGYHCRGDRHGYYSQSHYRRGCYDRGYDRRRGRSSCVFRYYVGSLGADFLCSSYDYR